MEPSEEDIAWLKSTFRPIPKPALPDDCIEYSLHIIDSTVDNGNDSELRIQLREVQKYANELQKQWLKDYIWQRQGFALELVKEHGVSILRGRTEYGDSIEDEWVIVWLLRELSKNFSNIWIKVTDSDGEFLLIEASGTIPTWLEPEVAENRVWMNNGHLKIIKPTESSRSSRRTTEKLSFKDAQEAILYAPKRMMQSTSIEEEAFYRLRNYPQQIKENIHHAMVRIPRKLAFLLLQRPAYIAPAIEAFYLRDSIALKPLQAKPSGSTVIFSPEDCVTVSVKFPKVGYAQIRAQDFPAPSVWKASVPPQTSSQDSISANTGMKVACGFEMLLSDPQYQDRSLVREMKLLLDDVDTGDAELPTDAELTKLEQKADDEKWLDINFEDLQNELDGAKQSKSDGKKREFGDVAAQENLQRIVKQFEAFLNDETGGPDAEGFFDDDSDTDLDDLDSEESDTGEDKEASFDEDEFTRLMQEMMGMPPEVMQEMMSGKLGAASNKAIPSTLSIRSEAAKGKVQEIESEDEEEDEKDVQDAMKRMEAELRDTGVLDLDRKQDSRPFTGARQLSKMPDLGSDDSTEEEEDEEDPFADMNGDFARNLLESFRSQRGAGGPASTLMSLMNEPERIPEKQDAKGKGKDKHKNEG